jgi:hypothetical protein
MKEENQQPSRDPKLQNANGARSVSLFSLYDHGSGALAIVPYIIVFPRILVVYL